MLRYDRVKMLFSEQAEYTCGSKSRIWKSEFRHSEITFFVLDYGFISIRIFVKSLPPLRCVAAFTNILIEIIIQYAQKGI